MGRMGRMVLTFLEERKSIAPVRNQTLDRPVHNVVTSHHALRTTGERICRLQTSAIACSQASDFCVAITRHFSKVSDL